MLNNRFQNKIKEIKYSAKYLERIFNHYIYTNIKLYLSILTTYFIFVCLNTELYYVNQAILTMLYWLGLGILSTIGLGFGFHTGIFFLFPYIISTYDIAENPTIFNTILKCLPIIIIWGVGGALGELPPYLLAKKYDKSELVLNFIKNKKILRLSETIKNKVTEKIDFTNKNVIFTSILLMASWPNLTFDMCGLLCGYYNIELNEFLVPTVIGKGLIKAPLQSLTVLYFYTNDGNYNISSYSPISFNLLFNCFFIGMLGVCINKTIVKLAKIEINHQITNTVET
jgi:vacuole membrane protein 1